MKHAGASALQHLSDLLNEVRERTALKEKSNGVFYCKSQAFLHFHEDPAGLFADLRSGAAFDRHRVDRPEDRQAFLAALDRAIARS